MIANVEDQYGKEVRKEKESKMVKEGDYIHFVTKAEWLLETS